VAAPLIFFKSKTQLFQSKCGSRRLVRSTFHSFPVSGVENHLSQQPNKLGQLPTMPQHARFLERGPGIDAMPEKRKPMNFLHNRKTP